MASESHKGVAGVNDTEDIDVDAWREYFDTFVPTFRLLTLGPEGGLPGGLMMQPLQVLGLRGTRFYSRAGLLSTPPPFLSTPGTG
jgi:hypothetical protein